MQREGRNRRRGCCNAEALLESGCGCGCGESLEEDMPMCRHTNPIFTCGDCCDCGCSCDCGGGDSEGLAAICAALQEQNRLLSELVCGITGLTGVALHCCRDLQNENDRR